MKSSRAFTLTELLVTIVIIGILAALLLPILGQAKERGYRTHCVNNLKQVAVALQTYADDHSDQLPGPIWQGFYEMYDNQNIWRLSYYLATYMGQPAPQLTPQDNPLTRCPSAARRWTPAAPGAPPMSIHVPLSYLNCAAVTNFDSGVVSRPFGYPYSSPPATGPDEPPKHLHEIANPTLSWAMTDADQQIAVGIAGYYSHLPVTPSHGTARNQLFFDGHVVAVPQ